MRTGGPLLRLNNNENPGPAPRVLGFPRRPLPAATWYLRERWANFDWTGTDLVGNGQRGDRLRHQGSAMRATTSSRDKTFAVYEWVRVLGLQGPAGALGLGFDDGYAGQSTSAQDLSSATPNNPTGSYWNEAKLRGFLEAIDGRQIAVVDEAYVEFVERPDFPDGVSLMAEYPNVVVFRTFSKMYALAGLRIGYLAGQKDVVDVVRRTCVVYSVNALAQEAALAAWRATNPTSGPRAS